MIEMSVILVVQGSFETVRRTTEHLRRQSVVRRLELVLVASSREELRADHAAISAFGKTQIVEVGAIESMAHARAEGVRAATAPVVVLAEDHCFPSPDWAALLIAAHEGPWAVVAPAIENGNPSMLVSWADFLLGYGPWAAPMPPQEMEHLPGHNSSFKREVLLPYGEDLAGWFEAESLLHWDLRKRGHRLYLESAARTAHVNFSRLSSWLRAQYHGGRTFAGMRKSGMTASMRIIYIAGGPLIPLVRFVRTWRQAWLHGRDRRVFARSIPLLLLGLSVNGIGQIMGHAFGPGRSATSHARLEYHRMDHLSPRDKLLGEWSLSPVDGFHETPYESANESGET